MKGLVKLLRKMMSPRLLDIVRVSYSSFLWQRPEVPCLQMSGDVILCRSFTRPSTALAVMKAWERGYVHVVVLVVSFPYCKDLIPSSKHRLVSFLYHGMGLRLSFYTSTPILASFPGLQSPNAVEGLGTRLIYSDVHHN